MSAKSSIVNIIDFNPLRSIKRGVVAPFVEMAALPEMRRDISYVSERVFTSGGSRFQNGDTLFARITPCLENGKTAKVNVLSEGVIAHGSTEFIVMAAKEPEYDEDYVYYLARHPDFRAFAESRMEGTSGRQRVSWQALSDFFFPFPPRNERKVIGSTLRMLDDKIQLNQQINQTLEQIAQAIFKSWFVDFEPVKAKVAVLEAGGSEEDAQLAAMQAISGKSLGELIRFESEHPEQYAELCATAELFPEAMQDSELGEIPEGWGVGSLGDLLHFNPRRVLRKGTSAPYLDMKNVPTFGHLAADVIERKMGSGTKFVNGDTLLARITPCLENGKTAFVDFLDENQVGWGSTEYIVLKPKDGYLDSLGYLLARNAEFRQQAIQSMTGTSGRQRANAKALAETPWVIYPEEIMSAFTQVSENYLALAKSKGDEAKLLASIRDTLLPKLLSAELFVAEVDKEVALS